MSGAEDRRMSVDEVVGAEVLKTLDVSLDSKVIYAVRAVSGFDRPVFLSGNLIVPFIKINFPLFRKFKISVARKKPVVSFVPESVGMCWYGRRRIVDGLIKIIPVNIQYAVALRFFFAEKFRDPAYGKDQVNADLVGGVVDLFEELCSGRLSLDVRKDYWNPEATVKDLFRHVPAYEVELIYNHVMKLTDCGFGESFSFQEIDTVSGPLYWESEFETYFPSEEMFGHLEDLTELFKPSEFVTSISTLEITSDIFPFCEGFLCHLESLEELFGPSTFVSKVLPVFSVDPTRLIRGIVVVDGVPEDDSGDSVGESGESTISAGSSAVEFEVGVGRRSGTVGHLVSGEEKFIRPGIGGSLVYNSVIEDDIESTSSISGYDSDEGSIASSVCYDRAVRMSEIAFELSRHPDPRRIEDFSHELGFREYQALSRFAIDGQIEQVVFTVDKWDEQFVLRNGLHDFSSDGISVIGEFGDSRGLDNMKVIDVIDPGAVVRNYGRVDLRRYFSEDFTIHNLGKHTQDEVLIYTITNYLEAVCPSLKVFASGNYFNAVRLKPVYKVTDCAIVASCEFRFKQKGLSVLKVIRLYFSMYAFGRLTSWLVQVLTDLHSLPGFYDVHMCLTEQGNVDSYVTVSTYSCFDSGLDRFEFEIHNCIDYDTYRDQ